MKTLTIRFLILYMAVVTTTGWAYGNDFSCSYGKQGACLDYNDKVCSSSAKCVSHDAVCFDSYSCDYKGFVCKTKFDDLVDNYNDLATRYKQVTQEYNDLVRRYKSLDSCISHAGALGEAQACDR